MVKRKVYKSRNGKIFNTPEEAARENRRSMSDVEYRYYIKSKNTQHPKEYVIPFEHDKKKVLTNAGLATGAIISENLLDTIAKHADTAGLPIRPAIGLGVKESTLGNPTDDGTFYLLFKPGPLREDFKALHDLYGTEQHLNYNEEDLYPREVFNWHMVDSKDPYQQAIDYATSKSMISEDGDIDREKFLKLLELGEKYADSKVQEYEDTYGKNNVVENAFRFYKNTPDKYNPGLSNYQLLVDKRSNEVMNSPEILEWYNNMMMRNIRKPDPITIETPWDDYKKANGGPLEWKDLSMRDRAAYIRLGVANGLKNIDSIRAAYNKFGKGGNKNISGLKQVFLLALDASLKDPKYRRYNTPLWRNFLTLLANIESGYRSNVTNDIGAKGYFLLMPSNRSSNWETPTQQFHETYNLFDSNLAYLSKNMTKKDWETAKKNGIDIYGLMGGAHLGGPRSVIKALRGKGNAKDKNGTSVLSYMQRFSQSYSNNRYSDRTYMLDMYNRAPKLNSAAQVLYNPELTTNQWLNNLLLLQGNEVPINLPLLDLLALEEEAASNSRYKEIFQEEPASYIKYSPLERLDQMRALVSPTILESLNNEVPITATEILLKQLEEANNSLLQKDLENNIIRNYTLGNYNPTLLQRDLALLNSNKFAEGGLTGHLLNTANIYDGDTEPTQQMQQGYIRQRPEGTYFYDVEGQPEIDVTPLNTSLSSNPADWSFTDASGKIYSPHKEAIQGTGELREGSKEGPILSAVNNYLRELNWRAKNDPSSILLQGKYTMPAIAASALLPIAGEAAAATNVAGVPLMTWADAGLTAGFGAHGLNHWINKGINGWGDAAMTALEIAPLGRLAKPMVEAATPYYNAFKTYLQNEYPAIFDPYTSWDATLGYHGDNIFSRFVGTAGRRFGYTPKAEIPEFHRRLNITKPESFRLTDDGKFIMSSGRTGEGHEGIVNFTTSEPARSHNKHKYLSGVDDFIVSPKAFEGVDFKSIQPSDTFFETPLSNTEFAVDPKYITFVSGEPTALDFARSIGMKTLSSPRLRALEADGPTFSGLLSRINNFKGAHSEHARSIGNEIQRLTSMRGAPTMQDYAHFEDMTGLNSGVVPASQWTGTNAIDLFGRESGVRGVPIFNNVAYDPATSIESIYRKAKTGEGTWEAYYDALENMPSARQQLGLNSAMDTYLGEPVIPEGYLTIKPQVRTKVGDVEIDDPNLLYHLDRGNGVGAFSNQGAYVENGMLLPGIAKEGEVPYSWWNLGRPYSTSVNGQPMTRLMTTTEDSPGMLHVRSQNYPIGQWNGKRGFVTNAEYVNPEGVNISGSTYALDPNYGWRRIFAEETPAAEWPVGRTTPQITAENTASEMPNIVRTVQDNGKIRLSLPSHTDAKPRLFVLEPAGDNKYYFHMRTWDDVDKHIPASLSAEEKNELFEALFNEIPEGAEILLPKSSMEVPATKGTIAGLERFAKDSRFTPGTTKGTLLYKDKDGKIKTYEGTSFIKTPQITEENAATMTPGGNLSVLNYTGREGLPADHPYVKFGVNPMVDGEVTLEEVNYAFDFINDILIPRAKLLGVWNEEFASKYKALANDPVLTDLGNEGTMGMFNGKVYLNDKLRTLSTFLHELRHRLDATKSGVTTRNKFVLFMQSNPLDVFSSDLLSKSVNLTPELELIIKEAYNGRKPSLLLKMQSALSGNTDYTAMTEKLSTNVEAQSALYYNYIKEFGKKPSLEEFYSWIDNMNSRELILRIDANVQNSYWTEYGYNNVWSKVKLLGLSGNFKDSKEYSALMEDWAQRLKKALKIPMIALLLDLGIDTKNIVQNLQVIN